MQLKGHMAGARLDTRVRHPFLQRDVDGTLCGRAGLCFFSPFARGLEAVVTLVPFSRENKEVVHCLSQAGEGAPPPPAPPVVLLPGRCDRKDCQVHEVSFLQDVCSVIDHDGAAVVHGVGSFAPPPCSGPHTEGPLQGPEPWADGQFGHHFPLPFCKGVAANDDGVATVNESLDGLAIRRGDDTPHLQDIVEVHHDFGADSLHSLFAKGLGLLALFQGDCFHLRGLNGRLSAGGLRAGRLGAALLRGRLFLDLGQRWPWATLSQDLPSRAGLAFSLSSCHCFLSFSKDSHDLWLWLGDLLLSQGCFSSHCPLSQECSTQPAQSSLSQGTSQLSLSQGSASHTDSAASCLTALLACLALEVVPVPQGRPALLAQGIISRMFSRGRLTQGIAFLQRLADSTHVPFCKGLHTRRCKTKRSSLRLKLLRRESMF